MILMMMMMMIMLMMMILTMMMMQVDEIIQEALFKAEEETAQMTALLGFVDVQVWLGNSPPIENLKLKSISFN